MAKKKPTKAKAPSIGAIAKNANLYKGRTRMYADEFAEFREVVREFARTRALPIEHPEHHDRGLRWLLKHGMRELNLARKAAGLAPVYCQITENSVLRWIDAELSEDVSKHFHR